MVSRGHSGGGHRLPHSVDHEGKPIFSELIEEDFQKRQFNTRYESILSRYDSKSGIMNEKYLDYNQTLQLKKLKRVLELNGSSLGDFMDWMAQQAVIRPSAGQSIHSVSNYLLQSFFVDVSNHGQNDGLFNNLVAEGIQICAELITECVAVKVVDASDPEKLIRQGFEEVAKVRNGAFNIRNMDQFFDDIEGVLERSVQSGEGRFAGMTSAAGAMYGEVGKYIAREIKKDRAFMKELEGESTPELTIKTYEFIQKRLACLNIQMDEPPEVTFAKENTELKNRIAKYETTTAGEELAAKEKPLQEARTWWQKLTGMMGRG